MEKLRVAVEKALPKRSRNIHQRATRCNTFDAINAQVGAGSDGAGDNVDAISQYEKGVVLRLKIIVKKQDLKQVIDQLAKNNYSNNHCSDSLLRSSVPMALSLEQRLNLMRRRQFLRDSKAKALCFRSSHSWRPALQSIPE